MTHDPERRRLLALLAAGVAAGAAGCAPVLGMLGRGNGGQDRSGREQSGPRLLREWHLGVLAPVTGPLAAIGKSLVDGVALAARVRNDGGGIRGAKVVVRTEDTEGRPALAAEAAARLGAEGKVAAIVGDALQSCVAAAATADRRGIPLLPPFATDDELGDAARGVFRVCASDRDMGRMLARHAVLELKLKRFSVLHDGSRHATAFRDGMVAELQGRGMALAADTRYAPGAEEHHVAVAAALGAAPDALVIPGLAPDVAALAKSVREHRSTLPLFGGDSWDAAALLEGAGAAIDGGTYVGHFAADDPRPSARAFVAASSLASGAAPDALSALAYDAAGVAFAAAIRAAGSADGSLAKEIGSTRDFPSTAGLLTIRAEGGVRRGAVLLRIVQGRPVFQAALSPPT